MGTPLIVALAVLAVAGLGATAAIERRQRRRLQHDVAALTQLVRKLPSRAERPNAPGLPPPLAELAVELGHAWSTVDSNVRRLELERDELIDALARTEARLRDPLVESRRGRLATLNDLHIELTVGPCTATARLVDLWLDHGVVEIDAESAARLVPGMPLTLHIETDEGSVDPSAVVAVAPAGVLPAGPVEWVVRFGQRLDVSTLPPSLWQAISRRLTQRILPSRDVPVTATLLTPFGDVAATVIDLSDGGIGLFVELEPEQLGDLHRGLIARIMFPTLGRMVVLPVVLRGVVMSGAGARLGLSFSDESGLEHGRLTEWIAHRLAPTGDYETASTPTGPWLDLQEVAPAP